MRHPFFSAFLLTCSRTVPFPQERGVFVARDWLFFNALPTGSCVMCDHFSIVAGHLLPLP